MNVISLFLWTMLIVNILTFVAYGIDKWLAVRGSWRISETTLLWLVTLGGGIGALAGMLAFRHKTKHVKFTVGVPAIMITEFILANILLYMITSQ